MARALVRALALVLSGFSVAWLAVRFYLPLPAALILWAGCVGGLIVCGAGVWRHAGRAEGKGKTWARILVIGYVAGSTLAALLVLPGLSGYIANTQRLSLFANQLHDYPPPVGTRALSADAEIGVLTGNGDHCDYRATVVLSAAESVWRRDVEEHYERLRPRSAVAGGDDSRVRLDVSVRQPESPSAGDKRLHVSLTDVHGPNADLRCW